MMPKGLNQCENDNYFGDAAICDCSKYGFGVMLCIFGVELRPDRLNDETLRCLFSPNVNELV